VVIDLIEMGRWHLGDRDILIVFDAGYDAPRMAHLLTGLPVKVLGRMRMDRVMPKPLPDPRISPPQGGGLRSTARSSVSPNRHLGRPGRGHGAGHQPVRNRPRAGLAPHPPEAHALQVSPLTDTLTPMLLDLEASSPARRRVAAHMADVLLDCVRFPMPRSKPRGNRLRGWGCW
jgi:hypothetical protein